MRASWAVLACTSGEAGKEGKGDCDCDDGDGKALAFAAGGCSVIGVAGVTVVDAVMGAATL